MASYRYPRGYARYYRRGNTPLGKAVAAVGVAAALAAGANPDARNPDWSETTLKYSAHNGLFEVAKILLDAGADVDAVGGSGVLVEASRQDWRVERQGLRRLLEVRRCDEAELGSLRVGWSVDVSHGVPIGSFFG